MDDSSYTLYKTKDCDISCIVNYLHFIGRGDSVIPYIVISNTCPEWATSLPSIKTHSGTLYIGLEQTIAFYEQTFGVKDVYNKAKFFKTLNPLYIARLNTTSSINIE